MLTTLSVVAFLERGRTVQEPRISQISLPGRGFVSPIVSHPPAIITSMGFELLDEAAGLLEKANANLEPELLSAESAREALAGYARIKRLASYGETVLARKIDDAHELALVTGTSIGKAQETVETGKRPRHSGRRGAPVRGHLPSSRRPRSQRPRSPGPGPRGSSSG